MIIKKDYNTDDQLSHNDFNKVALMTDPTTNFITPSTIIQNYAVNNSNWQLIPYNGFGVVRVEVMAGLSYTFKGETGSNSLRIRFEDSNNNLVSGHNFTSAPYTVTIPEGVNFAVYNAKEPNQDSSVYDTLSLKVDNRTLNERFLQDSKGVFLGDSFIAEPLRRANWYDPIVNDLQLNAVPIGGSGYTVTRGTGTANEVTPPGCILDLLTQVYSENPKYVVLEGGLNDCYYKMALGNSTTRTNNQLNYYDAYCNLVEQLITNIPGVRLAILVPVKRAAAQSGTYEDQLAYSEVPVYVAKRYSIPRLNLFESAWTEASLQASNFPTTVDGAHPSAFGGQIMARQIINFLKGI